VEKAPKPVASCAFPVMPNMNVKTTTPLVKKAREGVMEFLLINHPLDCPICDQGGECDLQDQAMSFGSDRSRFTEMKRSVEDKNLGPLVKTVMTRCIHCTRCVRFANEVAGVPDLGVTGRGNASEIGTYVEKLMGSELSGNVIDLCPVGALTSKPSAFTYRTWELKMTETIDVSDALGSNIRVDSRGTEVLRIVPRLNEEVNEEWISDKARFQYDGLKRQRLTTPYVRGGAALEPAQWGDALAAASQLLAAARPGAVRAVAGKLADCETLVAAKDMLSRLGSGDTRAEALPADLSADLRSSYVFNGGVAGLESADAVLLVGCNPRVEAPVLNARIRRLTTNGTVVGVVGPEMDLTYDHVNAGADVAALEAAAAGKGPFGAALKGATRPVVVVGASVLSRADRGAVMAAAARIGTVSVLHDSASAAGALDVGFVPSGPAAAGAAGAPEVVVLLGADDYADGDVPAGAKVIYIGSHGDRGAARADVILPGAAYTEKNATWVNTEGRAQRSKPAVALPGEARADWEVVRALSEMAGAALPYGTLDEVRQRMFDVAPHLVRAGWREEPLPLLAEGLAAGGRGSGAAGAFASSVGNFYQTDHISRASKTMARCVTARQEMRMQPGHGAPGMNTDA